MKTTLIIATLLVFSVTASAQTDPRPALNEVESILVAEGVANGRPELCDREVSKAGVYCHKWKAAINAAYVALESGARDEFRAAIESMSCLLMGVRDAERRRRLETILEGL